MDDLVYVGEFFRGSGLDDDEVQVGPLGAAVEGLEVYAHFVLEVVGYLLDDVGFGCGREAEDGGCGGVACVLLDEAADVAVVGAEVVSPLGEAVGFIQDPGAHLSLADGLAYCAVSEDFRRYEEDGGGAHPDLVECFRPFGHGQQAVNGDAGVYALGLQSCDLVCHERDQW